MLEFDDIQHILLTRAPRSPGDTSFSRFGAAGGRVAGGQSGNGAVGRSDAGFGRQGESLGDGGLHLERVAGARRGRCFAGHISRRVQAGNGRPRPDARRHRRESSGSLGRRIGQPGPSRDRDSVRPRRSGKRSCKAEHERLLAHCEGVEVLSSLDLNATPPFDHCPRSLRLSRSAIAAGDRRERRRSDARLGQPLKPGEFILGYPDEDGPPANLPQPEVFRATAASWPIAGCRSMWPRFATFCGQTGANARGAGTVRGETDGALAQRRTAGAGAGDKMIRHWVPIRSETMTSTTREWTRLGYAVPLGRTCGA